MSRARSDRRHWSAQLTADAKAATGADATRLTSLAETLKGRATRLR